MSSDGNEDQVTGPGRDRAGTHRLGAGGTAMAPCPTCGRPSLQGVVCLSCGDTTALPVAPLLAGADGGWDTAPLPAVGAPALPDGSLLGALGADAASPDADSRPPLRGVAGVVAVACALAVGAAALLLSSPGDPRHAASPAPAAASTAGSAVASSAAGTAPSTSIARSTPAARPAPAASTRAQASRSRASQPAATAGSRPPTTSAPAPAGPPAPARTVTVTKGAPVTDGRCNPRRCHYLDVSLAGFGTGTHTVSCFSAHSGRLGQYSTTAATSAACWDDHPHDTVWAVVDGVRSASTPW